MRENDRTKTVYINSTVTLLCQVLQILLGFIVRKIFIDSLGVAYLGYNSVFTNILQMLNLADMGIGVAITSFLFKPLTDGNKARVSALMYLYKKIYNIIGFIVLSIGLVVSVFLGTLIPDATCSIGYLRILFYINLSGTVSTYFLAYKRTLIIANQKSYITNLVDMIMFFSISCIQIICLLTAPNYIIYLILQIAKNIISNIIVSFKCDKEYGRIGNNVDEIYVQEYKPQIVQYVKDVFVSRIGATIFYSTDNVIISAFRGSVLAGYLSNYTMITTQLTAVINQVLASLQATFGNYVYSGKSIDEQQKMTNNYFCVNFIIGNFCLICFTLLAQPFISLFFGQALVLNFSTVLWLGINLMLNILIQLPSQVFIVYKLFHYDRPIIITSAVLNIIISIALVKPLGIDGVLIGTFVTSLIYLFSRFYIIAKHVYKVPYRNYVIRIILYFTLSAASLVLVYFVCSRIPGSSMKSFVIRMLLVALMALTIPLTVLSFTTEFKFLSDKFLPNRLKKFANKFAFGCISVLLVVVSILIVGYEQVNFTSAGNKSYTRTDSYVLENNTGNNIFNLTFDDTIDLFEDLTNSNYKSIFENSTLSWAKTLHDKHGVVVTFYTMFESNDFNLSQCPSKYKNEFISNSNWLKFGFHTLNGNTSYETGDISVDYLKTINELTRICGSDSIDNVVRLQSFQGSKEGVLKLLSLDEEPIIGLLTADDSRQSYYLDDDENKYIYCHDRMKIDDCYFISTDMRMEYVDNIDKKIKELSSDSWNNQTGDLVIFTHEWALNLETKEKVEKICQYALDNEYRFLFFEDVLK